MILDEIVQKKKVDLVKKDFKSIDEYRSIIEELPKPISFYQAMKKEGLSIIGEIKKASPSRGVIREVFHPKEIAKEYENAVDAMSILTEENYFLGKLSYIDDISKNCSLPILRKDFIVDEREIYEGRISGASAILLIVAILSDSELKYFIKLTKELNMDPLVEAHDEEEVKRAITAGADIIGINNRNLIDFSEDLNTTLRLRNFIPEEKLVISESAIREVEHIKILKQAKVNGILVGESFMRCENITEKAWSFKEAYR